jgi:hypothetical protein
LAIIVGEKNAHSRNKVNNKKHYREIEIANFKEKRLLLMSKSLKVILIISTLDTNNSHIKFI